MSKDAGSKGNSDSRPLSKSAASSTTADKGTQQESSTTARGPQDMTVETAQVLHSFSSKGISEKDNECQEDQKAFNNLRTIPGTAPSDGKSIAMPRATGDQTILSSDEIISSCNISSTSTEKSSAQNCATPQHTVKAASEICMQEVKQESSKDINKPIPAAIHPRPTVSNMPPAVDLSTRRLVVMPTVESSRSAPTATGDSFDSDQARAVRVHSRVAGTDVSNRLISPLVASTSPPLPAVQTKNKSGALRRGKWTVEEEAYVARVIQDFNSGFLNAPAGTTLRSYLSEKLQCDPMRITKKFTGDACIGKRVFHPAVRSANNVAAIEKAQSELDALERRWRRRLEMQQRESAKKAAASAAAAAAAAGRAHGFVQQAALGSPVGGHAAVFPVGQVVEQNVVTQTATWLDRASTILKGSGTNSGQAMDSTSLSSETEAHAGSQDLQSLPKNEIENQMKEVERLIHEGPLIQQTSAGLPEILDQKQGDLATEGNPTNVIEEAEPADKRLRTGAEDAEALVGFLTAVRASAASGRETFAG